MGSENLSPLAGYRIGTPLIRVIIVAFRSGPVTAQLKRFSSLARDLEERGRIDIEESLIDGTFVLAKKGAQNRENKAWKSRAMADASGLPVACLPRSRAFVEYSIDSKDTGKIIFHLSGQAVSCSDIFERACKYYGLDKVAGHIQRSELPRRGIFDCADNGGGIRRERLLRRHERQRPHRPLQACE